MNAIDFEFCGYLFSLEPWDVGGICLYLLVGLLILGAFLKQLHKEGKWWVRVLLCLGIPFLWLPGFVVIIIIGCIGSIIDAI